MIIFAVDIFYYIIKNMGVTDFFNGMANGFLSLVGAGSLYDKMGDASSKLNQIKEKTTNLTSTNSLLFAQDVNEGMETLLKLNNLTSRYQSDMVKSTKQFVDDSLKKENLFILFCYLLLFILVFFFLIQKKCC